ncbi:hypothetical protein AMTR_s00039p00106970 [Amborella trichopoda]|uniref:Uncharacterized protein n=1 Tax=Amborella trichopoda TaxID=13333 RepID=U5D021_AMBTC|nr:hypothetical protein AMTR_s00039p00106970 [Amborella trichopoda]
MTHVTSCSPREKDIAPALPWVESYLQTSCRLPNHLFFTPLGLAGWLIVSHLPLIEYASPVVDPDDFVHLDTLITNGLFMMTLPEPSLTPQRQSLINTCLDSSRGSTLVFTSCNAVNKHSEHAYARTSSSSSTSQTQLRTCFWG